MKLTIRKCCTSCTLRNDQRDTEAVPLVVADEAKASVDHFVGYEMPTQTIAMTPTHVIVDEDESYSYEI